jgi:glycine hydroxymethyltransferase
MDKGIFTLIEKERKRQQDQLEMIPSENYCSKEVMEAVGSVLGNKYSEGYPGRRYYQGNGIVDQIETLAIERAKRLFGVPHANVQPLSGAPANLAILSAVCDVGDPILSQHLFMGGHLSMGQKASVTSKYYKAYYYGLTREGDINWEELESQAKTVKPKIIFCGGTAFTKILDFPRFAKIADMVGAYFVADISHIPGLVVGGAHPSPSDFAHIIMTTTHKTLRGPRGAMIMATEKGLKKDPDLAQKIDKAVFPGLQGGPHENNIAALAIALKEASTIAFKRYAFQIVKNSKALAAELTKYGFKLIGQGSENHMVWIDLTNKGIDGWTAAWALEVAGIITNRQTIPFETCSPYFPSGLRLGTPAITTRRMKEKQMVKIADWINEVIEYVRKLDLIEGIGDKDKEESKTARKRFKKEIFSDPKLLAIKREVKKLCLKFPIP